MLMDNLSQLKWFSVSDLDCLNLKERLIFKLKQMSEESGVELTTGAVEELLESQQMFYYFGKSMDFHSAELPEVFTNIETIDCITGVIAMEICFTQCYRLFDLRGQPITIDYYHDVSFSPNGSLCLRPLDQKGGFHRYTLLEGTNNGAGSKVKLQKLETFGDLWEDYTVVHTVNHLKWLLFESDGSVTISKEFWGHFKTVLSPQPNSAEVIKSIRVIPELFSVLPKSSKEDILVQAALMSMEDISAWLHSFPFISVLDHFDKSKLLELLKTERLSIRFYPYKFEMNALKAIANLDLSESALELVNAKCQDLSYDEWLYLTRINGGFLKIVPRDFLSEELVLSALVQEQGYKFIQYAPIEVLSELSVALAVVDRHPQLVTHFIDLVPCSDILNRALANFIESNRRQEDLPF